jgi:murein L,D-transpeptidase YcbB/YkuD
VGKETLAELRASPSYRAAQISANLERWRWLPDRLGERHIRVNIADFELQARAGGQIERVHRVIVGRQLRRTPSFSSSMRYIVVNPWWEVPRRLAVEDKLPLFQREPEAVQRLGFRIVDGAGQEVEPSGIDWNSYTRRSFPFRLRQQPGRENALGEVKLMFPNRHDVYLHDTPGRTLFERSRRNFSSGCMRVEHPLALAAWALNDASWPLARLEIVAAGDQETTITLKQRVPVHIQYLTAVVEDGEVRFVYDLYGRDAALMAALAERTHSLDARPEGGER